MTMYITTLRQEHLEEAAALVSARYKAMRKELPILPPLYERAQTLLEMLYDLQKEAEGIVTIQDGRLVGFLSGFVISSFLGKRAVYCPDWANGADLTDSRRIYEEMYKHISAQWVIDECFLHVISILGNDQQGFEGWHWLGFGLGAVDGVRSLEPVQGEKSLSEVRRAGLEDAQQVAGLWRDLEDHLAAAPTFWIHERQDCEKWLRESGNVAWLAYRGDEPVGFMALEPGNNCECAFLQDDKTINITGAFTKEDARGSGIATELLNRVLEWAQETGYERCSVDFEAMNILASRFWMRWFNPVSYSLIRIVDERVKGLSSD